MEPTSPTVFRERAFAGILLFLGLGSLAYSVSVTEPHGIQFEKLVLAVLFTGVIVLADRFPIHLIRRTKASLVNMPIYLTAVVLPAPLAIGATGAGLLIADFIARTERGLLPRDMLATAGQWMFTAFFGYQIIHTSLPGIQGATSWSRVIAAADSFDAMTSHRPYRTAISLERAIQILLEGRGNQSDADVVNGFVDMIDKVAESLAEQPRSNCSDQLVSREFWHTSPAIFTIA